LTYLDQGDGALTLRAAGRTFPVALGASGRWKTAEFETVAGSWTADSSGAHIAIDATSEVTLHMIEVAR
jgi:hypothetical protein